MDPFSLIQSQVSGVKVTLLEDPGNNFGFTAGLAVVDFLKKCKMLFSTSSCSLMCRTVPGVEFILLPML